MTLSDDMNQDANDAQSRIASYITQAEDASGCGDAVLAVHLYLAAFGYASSVSSIPNESAIRGLKRAWSIACALKERALAEYIFEKMEPYLSSSEASHCASQLQALALDKLAEFGLSREAIAKMTGLSPDGSVNPGSFKLVSLSTVHHPLDNKQEGDGSESPSHAAIADRDDAKSQDDADVQAPDDVAPADDAPGELDEGLLRDLDEVFSGVPDAEGGRMTSDGSMGVADMIDRLKDAISATAGVQESHPAVEGLDEHSLAEKFSQVLGEEARQDDAESQPAYQHVIDIADNFTDEEHEVISRYLDLDSEDPDEELDLSEHFSPEEVEVISRYLDEVFGQMDAQDDADGGWDPDALPTLTDDGLALGPNFGLRAKPKNDDAQGAEFEDMLKSLGVLMEGFDSKTGERIPSSQPADAKTLGVDQHQVELLTYADLVGYDAAIQTMQSFGIGMRDDPDYLMLVEALNQLHGMDKVPATDAMLFRSLAREDANRFMEATANEIDLPMLRMSMDENLQGAFMLCLSVRADKAPQMNRQHTAFEGPAILCLEDIDLWMSPTEYFEDDMSWAQRLTRGARETVQMIRAAVEDPNVYVMATMSSYGEIDPFFCDLLTPFSVIDIDVPNDIERTSIWRTLQREHPSLANLGLGDLVKYSANMPRADIYTAVREALEEAYKQSLAMRTYLPVSRDNLLEKLSAYQPLDSDEYRVLEDAVAGSLRTELDAFDSVDALLGFDEGDADPDDGPLYDDDMPISTDNPYFAL